MFAVLVFLAAVTIANLTVVWFGPWITVVNALILIGLDLSLRDKLHERWHGKHLILKMGLLIIAGGAISYVLNHSALRVAIASICAFTLSATTDAIVYELLINRKKLVKMNASNIASALIDSIAFPTIAFGEFLPLVVLGQFAAKVIGGFIWSLILTRKSICQQYIYKGYKNKSPDDSGT